MTGDASAPHEDDRSLRPANEELNRLLIDQFYKDSVALYGPDSEQARALSRLRTQSGRGRASKENLE